MQVLCQKTTKGAGISQTAIWKFISEFSSSHQIIFHIIFEYLSFLSTKIQLWYQCTFKTLAFTVFHNINVILAFSNNVNVILAFLHHFLLNSPNFGVFAVISCYFYLMKGVIPKHVIERKLLC